MRTFVEISRSALIANYQSIRRAVGEAVEILAVVKADAYGHGAHEIAATLEQAGARWFGVTSVAEAVQLRTSGIQGRIVVLSHLERDEHDALLELNLTAVLHTVGQLRDLEALARRRQSSLDFHLEFDSGMGRMGIEEARAGEVADVLAAAPYLRLEGLATHFASAENMASGQTEEQLLRFNALVSKLSARGVRPPFIHMANSAALAYRADTWGTMVRPGLALYGYVMPSEGGQVQPVIHPAPILTWKAQIIAIKQYGAGVPLGYNASFTTPRPMRVGVLGVGYGDGLDRRLSNGGSVLAKGRLAPIVGLISMDVSLVDLSSSPEVVEGEYVTLLGAEGGLKQDALDLAAHCRTIPYEILCGISRRAPRIYR